MDKEFFMGEALKEAKKALEQGEVPIGAVVVLKDEIIGRGHNRVETEGNSTRHAEMVAMEEACKKLESKWLSGCHIYVTLEPCTMCSGAIVLARPEKLIYGATDPKTGACGSLYNIVQDQRLNHYIEIEKGLMETQCSSLLKDFFKNLRKSKREEVIR